MHETQDLQKRHAELLEELGEVREQYKVADKARQEIPGLHLELEEYKRILPKVEQDRHDLQMMKKTLELDHDDLTAQCASAKEQHERDQQSIAELTGKLADYELSQGSASVGLKSEIEDGPNEETRL